MEARTAGGAVGTGPAPAPIERGPAAFLGEFIGTFLLVLVITLSVSLFRSLPSATNPNPFVDWTVIGLAQGLVLFLLVQTLAVVSGAHLNPAVTAAMTLLRQIRIADAAVYVVCQLAGAVLAALLTKGLLTHFPNASAVHYGAPAVGDPLSGSIGLGFVAELVGTFLLVWAIVGVAVNPVGLKDWSGLVIGLTLGFVVMIFGPLTGASVNPARGFGPALVSGHWGGAGHYLVVYVLAALVGAILAAAVYFYMYILPGRKTVAGMEPVG